MEVDRIWRIDGLDGHANPAWQNSARRRRRFVEDVEAAEGESGEPDLGEEQAGAQEQGEQNHPIVSMSDDTDAPLPAEDDRSFRAIA